MAGAVDHAHTMAPYRRNMPGPFPVLTLVPGTGTGTTWPNESGIRPPVVYALHERAKCFLMYYSIGESTVDPLVLIYRKSGRSADRTDMKKLHRSPHRLPALLPNAIARSKPGSICCLFDILHISTHANVGLAEIDACGMWQQP